ncbi:hypothetical protein [Candidatus Methanocrinis natronophilus]|uniref:Uncharacterized protein n=1 Tax=Candidatus Methanocrinis natronophilus TaxID=3033396 RepID=A0ABT5X5E8_9EURY|nr:hypothetical protein [Candidatus Methanocrinis natronophilus]MDF0589916.1 hypothetical protein [Candidatus Methanocrinis natronophilus]
MADEAKSPFSRFVIEIVESTLAEDEELRPRREMVNELESVKNENKKLRDDLHQKDIVIDRYESELKRYRNEVFLSSNFEGIRRYSKELVDILKSGNYVDSYRLLEALNIDPRESEQIQAVSHQLEELEEYEMIKPEGRGWRWIGQLKDFFRTAPSGG